MHSRQSGKRRRSGRTSTFKPLDGRGAGNGPAVVRGLLDLGRTLRLQTVAEGVELAAQEAELLVAGRAPVAPELAHAD